MRRLALLWAHFFFLGFFPLFPGTFTSLVVCFLYWEFIMTLPLQWKIFALLFIILTAIPASSAAAEYHRKKDPRSVVIDEVAGQFLALIPAQNFLAVTLSFFLFRLFDTLKPPPINYAERLKGGLGIVADDLVGGALALVLLLVINP